jgi:DNA end-binding protein Ku
VAFGRFTMRDKEHLVMIRPYTNGLMLHTIYYADEVRPAEEVDRAAAEHNRARASELVQLSTPHVDKIRLAGDPLVPNYPPPSTIDSYRERARRP